MLMRTLQNPWRLNSTQRTVGNRGKLGQGEGVVCPKKSTSVGCPVLNSPKNIHTNNCVFRKKYICMHATKVNKKGAINFKRAITGVWEGREEGKEGKIYLIKLQS